MSFAFVIPIVHPEAARVGDYGAIESTLRVTLENLTAQSSPSVNVVVVCHRLPAWHAKYEGKVHFLLIGAHPKFPAKRRFRFVDKGLKLMSGAVFAIDHLSAKYLMLMDGDDFAKVDLAHRVQSGDLCKPGRDGWIITSGFHAQLRAEDENLTFERVYKVRHFNRNCGSCRIFLAKPFLRHVERISPRFEEQRHLLPKSAPAHLPSALVNSFWDDAPKVPDLREPFIVLGNHTFQEPLFNFARVAQPLMTKGCGHDYHSGPRNDVYWYRVQKQVEVSAFMTEFGLSNSPFAKMDPIPHNWLETAFRPPAAWLLQGSRHIVRGTWTKLWR